MIGGRPGGVTRWAGERAADPEMRVTANVFERVFGTAPARVRHVPGALPLLGGAAGAGGHALTVGLPWGVICALGPGPLGLYSMNLHTGRYTGGAEPPSWAAPALRALRAHGPPSAQMVLNRELPSETGLPAGAGTFAAASRALREDAPSCCDDPACLTALHARPGHALHVTGGAVEHVPCDLAAAGLRFLIIDVGARTAVRPAEGDVQRSASALRNGDLAAFGALLTEVHVRGEPTLDQALEAAFRAGALGGLAVGRCAVALTPVSALPLVRNSVMGTLAGRTRRPPRFLTAVPSGPRQPVTASG